MAIPQFTWIRYVALLLVYWVLVIGGWTFYIRHRFRQRRVVREQDVKSWDPVTGRLTLTITHEVNLLSFSVTLLGVPIVVLVAWLVLG